MTETAQKHIETLRKHGARVGILHQELNSFFVDKAIDECNIKGYNMITYDLFLDGINEPMMIAIWKDGHVDTGSVKAIMDCLAQY